MTPDRWKKVEELFHAALALNPEERDDYLQRLCPDDPDLRREVQSLLSENDDDPAFLSDPVANVSERPETASAGDDEKHIGPYTVIRTIGSGGMGEVFLAKRTGTDVQHFVALKVVRAPVLTPEARARFGNERSILARLNHPNISRFLHGDVTDMGQPYLAMEYIQGEPITDYVRRNELAAGSCLDIFETVCDAVHYAHQNLIVHRDLKPGNILVTETGVPKLLDFGIAKLLEPDESTFQTRTEFRVLTPEYASPEQLRGETVSTATDVYSLGVLLYELLTASRPYDLKGKSPAEVERTVAGTIPTRPSELVDVLDDDLDTIVLKAMQPDAARRYASVQQLTDDIRRYRSGFPIRARPDSMRYRVRKFVGRHRFGVAAVSAIAALLVLSTIVTSIQSVEIQRRSEEVIRERDRAERVVEFLSDIYLAAAPNAAKGEDPTVRELLDRAAQRFESELSEDPEIQAEMYSVIASVYQSLGSMSTADTLHGRALELRREVFGSNHGKVAASLGNLANIRRSFGDYDSARERYDEGLAAAIESGAVREEIQLRHQLGFLHQDRGQYEEAKASYETALKMAIDEHGEDHEISARILFDLGWILEDLGDFEAAEAKYREALQKQTAQFGEDHTDVAKTLNNLGWLLAQQSLHEEAEPMLRRALRIRERLLGREHQSYAQSVTTLGLLLKRMGQTDGAIELLREALFVYTNVLGEPHSYVAAGQNNLGTTFTAAGRPDSAEVYLRKALGSYTALFGEDHPNVGTSAVNLAHALYGQGDLDGAEEYFRVGLEIDRKTLGPQHHYVAGDLLTLAELAVRRGQPDRAMEIYREALDIYAIARPDGDLNAASAQVGFANLLSADGEYEDSVPLLRSAAAFLLREFGENDIRTMNVQLMLAEHLVASGTIEETRALVDRLRVAYSERDDDVSAQMRRIDAVDAKLNS